MRGMGRIFGNTPPGDIEHNDGRDVEHRSDSDERIVNKQEVGELCENEKRASRREIDQWAQLTQDCGKNSCNQHEVHTEPSGNRNESNDADQVPEMVKATSRKT